MVWGSQHLGPMVFRQGLALQRDAVFDGRTGLLQSSGNVASLTADLIKLLQNPDQRAQMGQAAAAHIAANFNWASLAEKLESAYSASGNR